MAHTKSGGSTKLGRESAAQRLGVKIHDGQPTRAGQIIIRQRGSQYLAGVNVRRAGDDSLYAGKAGTVSFGNKAKIKFDGTCRTAKIVHVR